MRKERFTFLCTPLEKQLLRAIASQLKRSQSDAIRILIYRAADELGIDDEHHILVKPIPQGENDE